MFEECLLNNSCTVVFIADLMMFFSCAADGDDFVNISELCKVCFTVQGHFSLFFRTVLASQKELVLASLNGKVQLEHAYTFPPQLSKFPHLIWLTGMGELRGSDP